MMKDMQVKKHATPRAGMQTLVVVAIDGYFCQFPDINSFLYSLTLQLNNPC